MYNPQAPLILKQLKVFLFYSPSSKRMEWNGNVVHIFVAFCGILNLPILSKLQNNPPRGEQLGMEKMTISFGTLRK